MSSSDPSLGKPQMPRDQIIWHANRIAAIFGQIEQISDPSTRELMQEWMESVLNFYGRGLERILALLAHSEIAGEKVINDLVQDPVVSGLLLIHGLHPHGLGKRLEDALNKVRPYMKSHGGDVELLSLENGFARLRLKGSCKGCPSSAITLELAVRRAIEEACPDLAGFEVEGSN